MADSQPVSRNEHIRVAIRTVRPAVLLLYFVLTFAQELPATGVMIILVKELDLEPSDIAYYYATIFWPWTIKPVYAFISDQKPIFSYRRRPYILVCCLLAAASMFYSSLAESRTYFTIAGTATSLFAAWSEVVTDSVAVELTNKAADEAAAQRARARPRSASKTRATAATAATATGALGSHALLNSPSVQSAEAPLLRAIASYDLEHVAAQLDRDEQKSTLQNERTADARDKGNAASVGDVTVSITRVDKSADAKDERTLLDSSARSASVSVHAKQQRQAQKLRKRTRALSTEDAAVAASSSSSAGVLTASPIRSRMLFADRSAAATNLGSDELETDDSAADEQPSDSSDKSKFNSESERLVASDDALPSDHKQSSSSSGAQSEQQPADALRVASYSELTASVQSAAMFVRTFGSLVATATSILLLKLLSPRAVITGASGCYLLALLPARYLQEEKRQTSHFGWTANSPATEADEQRMTPWQFVQSRIINLWLAFKVLLRPVLFVFIFNAMPNSADAYSTFLIDTYDKFENWQYSLFQFIGFFGALAGVVVYWNVFAKMTMRKAFTFTTILAALAGCTQIVLATKSNQSVFGIPDALFVGGDAVVVQFFQRMALMPGIVLASQCCPAGLGLEASMFSLFSAAGHLAALTSSFVTGRVTTEVGVTKSDWSPLWVLILLCNASTLLPLLLLPCLPVKPAGITSRELSEEQAQLQQRARTFSSRNRNRSRNDSNAADLPRTKLPIADGGARSASLAVDGAVEADDAAALLDKRKPAGESV